MALLALFGGYGEFDPWSTTVHTDLVRSGKGDGSVAILPMALSDEAIAQEDLRFFAEVGIPAVVVPVRTREDAEQQANAEALMSASSIFLHGGRPNWLVECLQDTAVWGSILEAIGRGASFAATSAGIECLGELILSYGMNAGEARWESGLGLFPSIVIGSHWNSERRAPLREMYKTLLPEKVLLAIDERTSILGNGESWTVFGEGVVRVGRGENELSCPPKQEFDLDLGLGT